MDLQALRQTDVRQVDKSSLTQLEDIQIRKGTDNLLDVEDLLRQVANPYIYRVGDMVVAFDYLDNGRTVNDAFALMVQASM